MTQGESKGHCEDIVLVSKYRNTVYFFPSTIVEFIEFLS